MHDRLMHLQKSQKLAELFAGVADPIELEAQNKDKYAARHYSFICASSDEFPALMADQYLKIAVEHRDSLAGDDKALTRLRDAYQAHALPLWRKCWADDITPTELEVGGVYRPDACLAIALEAIGSRGRELGPIIRKSAPDRWKSHAASKESNLWTLWVNKDELLFPKWVQLLLEALWFDVVRPGLEKEARVPTALVYPVHEDLTRVHSSTFKTVEKNGQRRLEFPDTAIKLERIEPLDVPACEMEVVNKLLDKGLNHMGSIAGHKLLRWEVRQGHIQVLSGKQDPRKLEVEGGWAGLAETIDIDPGKWSTTLHQIVVAQAHCAFRFPGGSYGNLLSYTIWPARGRRRGSVTIILGDPLLPHFVFALKSKLGNSRALAEAQRLVPVVDIPPLVGSSSQHGPQATMSMAIVSTMREQAIDMATMGGALLAFDHLAARSKIKAVNVPAIIDRWTQDGTDAPAFLKKVDSCRHTLGDAHKPARDFIVKAGQDSLVASSNGKASVQKRERSRK